MDSRKVSSLSILSDASGASSCASPRPSNLLVEDVGLLPVPDPGPAPWRRLAAAGSFVCALAGEQRVLVTELRLRADTECVVARSAVLELPGARAEERRYLDCGLVVVQAEVRLLLLGERRNKERFCSVVEVLTSGQARLQLGRELAVYDKASMLGKQLTHLATSSNQGAECEVFTCGNLIRKLRTERAGAEVKLAPTTARVQVPPECVDGTLSLCVASHPTKSSFTIVASFKTKSAGKNKYQICWFQGRGDEISAPGGKSAVKLGEDQEPSVVLADPRDPRAVFVLCNNSQDSTAGLHKLVRGRKLEEAIATFPFPVTEAALVLGADKSLFLLALDPSNDGGGLRVYQVVRTQGYRGQQAAWARCPQLAQAMGPAMHAVSCSQQRWQLAPAATDLLLGQAGLCPYQLGLATLATAAGSIATEPESGGQYRLRAVGGDAANDAILIVLEDIERCFEAEEESLASMTLKLCLSCAPGREGLSQVSGWLMAGRLASVELSCTRLDQDQCVDSDRLLVQTLPTETFRSYLLDLDWTQRKKKEGTFVLDSPDTSRPNTGASSRPGLASALAEAKSRSSSLSRLPARKLTAAAAAAAPNGGCGAVTTSDELAAAVRQVEETVLSPLARANTQIRDGIAQLEASLDLLRTLSAGGVVENNNNDSF